MPSGAPALPALSGVEGSAANGTQLADGLKP